MCVYIYIYIYMLYADSERIYTSAYTHRYRHTDAYIRIHYITQRHTIPRQPGRDSWVGITTLIGLDGPGIELRWVRDFPDTSRPGPRPIWSTVSGLFPRIKRPERGVEHPPPLVPKLSISRALCLHFLSTYLVWHGTVVSLYKHYTHKCIYVHTQIYMHTYTKLHYITCIHTHTHTHTNIRTYVLARTLLNCMHGKHMCLRHTGQNFILVSFQFFYEVFGGNPDYTLEEYPHMLIFRLSPPNMGRVS
jgi:hypothetical protein